MKFPYREYISQFPGTSDFRLILRPVIPIRVFGPNVEARWDALVDTGADVSTIPVSRRDHIHIGKQVLYAANGMIIPIDKNYSSLIWDSVVFFNGLS